MGGPSSSWPCCHQRCRQCSPTPVTGQRASKGREARDEGPWPWAPLGLHRGGLCKGHRRAPELELTSPLTRAGPVPQTPQTPAALPVPSHPELPWTRDRRSRSPSLDSPASRLGLGLRSAPQLPRLSCLLGRFDRSDARSPASGGAAFFLRLALRAAIRAPRAPRSSTGTYN